MVRTPGGSGKGESAPPGRNASKSAIPSPVGLVNLGHNVSDCASKVRVYLQTGKIHAGYLGMSGDGPVRCQDQQITSQQ